ncbi:MAG: hypothetical protein WB816_06055 [Methylocystis sp.]
MRVLHLLLIVPLLSGCAKTAFMPFDGDIGHLAVAGETCGFNKAQTTALRRAAAIETINRGYDRFMLFKGQGPDAPPVLIAGAYTNNCADPGSAESLRLYGRMSSIAADSCGQSVTIKMFRDADPLATYAVSSRQTLGSDWRSVTERPDALIEFLTFTGPTRPAPVERFCRAPR